MTVRFKVLDQVIDTGESFRGLNLLGHAQMIELFIGSECGGHGKCGKDRVILSPTEQLKVNPPTEIEKHQLTESELAMGMRLACQCFPNSDKLMIEASVLSSKAVSIPLR